MGVSTAAMGEKKSERPTTPMATSARLVQSVRLTDCAESAPEPLMGGPVASDGLRRTGTLTVGPEARGPRTNRIRPYIVSPLQR